QRVVRQYVTSRPRTDAGRAIYKLALKLTNINTVKEAAEWTASEVPRVLFLGICLDRYYFLWRGLLPKIGFHLNRGSVSQALVE
ncbi:hypothetical protein ACOI92_13935, partial [Corynebacterium striatum]